MNDRIIWTCPHRRAIVPGGTWFFTVNLLSCRGNDLLVREIDLLRNTVRRVQDWPYPTFHQYLEAASILCDGGAMWMWTCRVMNDMRPITLR